MFGKSHSLQIQKLTRLTVRRAGSGAGRRGIRCILRRFTSIKQSLTEVNYGSLPLAISFSFRPTPSCRFSFACEPHIIPRPQVGGRASRYRFAAASGDTVRPLPALLVRSLTMFVRYCSLLPVSACFCLFLFASDGFRSSAASRSPSRRPIRKAGNGFRFVCSPLPACFN